MQWSGRVQLTILTQRPHPGDPLRRRTELAAESGAAESAHRGGEAVASWFGICRAGASPAAKCEGPASSTIIRAILKS
jgi:hypothetical protein